MSNSGGGGLPDEEYDSIGLRDECPECSYPPRPHENVHFWGVETEIGTCYAVECPECGTRFIFAIKTPDSRALPSNETLIELIEQVGL